MTKFQRENTLLRRFLAQSCYFFARYHSTTSRFLKLITKRSRSWIYPRPREASAQVENALDQGLPIYALS
jgi:hypothetical protein